jgi:hypothetical protein
MVSLLPLVLVLLALAWQAVIAGHAVWSADAAARAAARAAATGGDAGAAARARLDDDLEPGLGVRDKGDGTVEVAVRVPSPPGLPRLGRITATAHFTPQR